jgi:hypothetical protein
MRIPDDLLTIPVFIGGRNEDGGYEYRGTAFFAGVETDRQPLGWPCLVTARHNVRRALERYGNVCVRVNTEDGAALDIEIETPWVEPDDPGVDVAAVPFARVTEAPMIIPPRWFVTEDIIAQRGIGPGEEAVVLGMFQSHVGKRRNLPIVRNGHIASMPLEAFVDQDTGDEFEAYLLEVRSIGGLSGSPVFVVLNPPTRLLVSDAKEVSGQYFYLLGVVRGHWDRDAAAIDYAESERDRLNTGIAMVTPITELLPLFEDEVFVRYRRQQDEAWDAGAFG